MIWAKRKLFLVVKTVQHFTEQGFKIEHTTISVTVVVRRATLHITSLHANIQLFMLFILCTVETQNS